MCVCVREREREVSFPKISGRVQVLWLVHMCVCVKEVLRIF